jgi:hypothetical protein
VDSLVFGEVHDLDIPSPLDLIADNEPMLGEVCQEQVNIDLVVREQLGLESPRPVFEPTLPVSSTPEADEEEPCLEREGSKFLIDEERWLDDP